MRVWLAPRVPTSTSMSRPRTAPGLIAVSALADCGTAFAVSVKYTNFTCAPLAGARLKVIVVIAGAPAVVPPGTDSS
jgi:hypothetical protein